MATLITPDGTVSYPHLFAPRMPPNPRPGQKARYQCAVLFPKDMPDPEKELLLAMKRAALDAAKAKWGAKTEELIQAGTVRWPFSKKWTDKLGNQKYDPDKWQCFINPWSEQAPGIVSRYKGPDGKPMKVTDQSEVYAGAIVRVSVNVFVYEQSGNWGVNFGLQNVQLRGDGPRLDNRLSAADTFDADDRPEADITEAPTPGADPAMPPPAKVGGALADLFT